MLDSAKVQIILNFLQGIKSFRNVTVMLYCAYWCDPQVRQIDSFSFTVLETVFKKQKTNLNYLLDIDTSKMGTKKKNATSK